MSHSAPPPVPTYLTHLGLPGLPHLTISRIPFVLLQPNTPIASHRIVSQPTTLPAGATGRKAHSSFQKCCNIL